MKKYVSGHPPTAIMVPHAQGVVTWPRSWLCPSQHCTCHQSSTGERQHVGPWDGGIAIGHTNPMTSPNKLGDDVQDVLGADCRQGVLPAGHSRRARPKRLRSALDIFDMFIPPMHQRQSALTAATAFSIICSACRLLFSGATVSKRVWRRQHFRARGRF